MASELSQHDLLVRDGGSAAEAGAGPEQEPARPTFGLQPEPVSRPEGEPVPRARRPVEEGRVRSAPVEKAARAIQMNYRLNLGEDLSERLQRLADAHDQPIELIMKGLRTRSAEKFRMLASGTTKPHIPAPETGGGSIRYAASISGDMAANLSAWFDPFGLGIAKDACKPLLIGLFQEEAKALCECVDMPQTDHAE